MPNPDTHQPADRPVSSGDVTLLLAAAAGGDSGAESELLERVYAELHGIARGYLAAERPGLTIGATAVVNEAYVRLFRPGGSAAGTTTAWTSKRAFFHVAALAMRRVLIDHARRRMAARRTAGAGGLGAGGAVTCDVLETAREGAPEEIMALDDALVRLEEVDPRAAEVVRLRYLVGLTVEQTAEVLSASPRTVKRDWEFARAWLQSVLEVPRS